MFGKEGDGRRSRRVAAIARAMQKLEQETEIRNSLFLTPAAYPVRRAPIGAKRVHSVCVYVYVFVCLFVCSFLRSFGVC